MLKQQMFLTNIQSILVSSRQTHSLWSSEPSKQTANNISTWSNGPSRQGTNSMSLNKNKDKGHHHQASGKRKHPSDDEICDDDDDDDDDDRLLVTAGHDFDVTADGEDELSLYSKEVEKGEADTPEEGQLYESRYHDFLSVVEDDLRSTTEKQFAEVCHKILDNSKNNVKLKAEIKGNIVPKNCTFMKTTYLNPEIILEYQTQLLKKDKAAQRK